MNFELGRIVATPGAIRAMEAAGSSAGELLGRHARLEQGALDAEDHRLNQRAVKTGDRIFSAFTLGDHTKVWVITEADRSSTCVLLPEEY